MQNRFLTILLLIFIVTSAKGEEEEAVTYALDSINVYAGKRQNESDFSMGDVYRTDGRTIERHSNTSMAELLAENTPFILKQNGNGMMTTLSLRGTSASHTQTIWNGLSITPLTMGQTDYSTLPVFFFEQINIHPGGGSAIFGEGAIGGAVTLQSDAVSWRRSRSLSIMEEIGSFGKTFSGIKFKAGNKKIQSVTKAFFNRCENDFKFQFRDETLTQNHASYKNFGALNETKIRINTQNVIGTHVWFTRYDRDIQPMMQNNDDASKYEEINDQSVKIVTEHLHTGHWLNIRNQLAWMNDRELFGEDLIATHDLTARSNARKDFKKGSAELGGDLHYIKPEVYAYKAGTKEWRGAIFLLTKYSPCEAVTLYGNMRKSFASDMEIPFSPAFGFSVKTDGQKKFRGRFGGNVARNTKVPTLNDRYWGDYANKELTPETAFNLEVNSDGEFDWGKQSTKLNVTVYRNNVDGWILWMPRGNVWKPTNIENVLARGIETNLRHHFKISQSSHEIMMSYNHSFTEIIKGFEDMKPFEGRQMPLTPQNLISCNWNITYKEAAATISGNYTGERTSSDIFDKLEEYFLLDLFLRYKLIFSKKQNNRQHTLLFGAQIKNLLNTNYQSLPFRAMPGRNFSLSVTWELTNEED